MGPLKVLKAKIRALSAKAVIPTPISTTGTKAISIHGSSEVKSLATAMAPKAFKVDSPLARRDIGEFDRVDCAWASSTFDCDFEKHLGPWEFYKVSHNNPQLRPEPTIQRPLVFSWRN